MFHRITFHASKFVFRRKPQNKNKITRGVREEISYDIMHLLENFYIYKLVFGRKKELIHVDT